MEGMERSREKMIVDKEPVISGDDVNNAWASKGPSGWEINVGLKGDGADELFRISKQFAGGSRQMAIVLDDEVISAPTFRTAIAGGNCQITGDFTMEQARTLATSMKNPLRTKPQIEHEEYFPPTLAKSAVNQGLRAGLWGLGLTAVFMVLFYRFAGIIALIGLSVNIILLFGILAIFQADFTLTGIAGVILTIGIAIDANVLIYERLREERESGKSIGAAIQAAYEKAFSAIFDAQVTTLITAMILLALAEGAIKGFAVTLTIGIIVSLFSALLVTRVCFNWLISGETLGSLKFMNTLGKRAVDFLSASKLTRLLSLALIVIAIAVLGMKGKDSLGVEFAGGDQIRFQASEAADTASVTDAVNAAGLTSEPKVQSLTPVGGEGKIFSVRVDGGKGQAAAEQVVAAGLNATEVQTEKISSVVAGQMAKNSLIALLAGLFAIFIYVSLRFEYSFAIGAIAALVHDLVICIGITVLAGRELNLILVGAFLTIAGYSINDTIVVFDRIREGLRNKRGDVKDIMNQAINATLSRTILTSLTTLLTVGCLFLFGGKALNDFSFAVIIGVIVGTYSSIFVASPIVYWWAKRSNTNLRREVLDADQEKVISMATE
jgi:SecD/SecF fusion protein